MVPITAPIPGHDLRIHELVAVFRLLSAPVAELAAVLERAGAGRPSLPLGDEGRLEIVTPFAEVPGPRRRWRARARLHGRGPRLVPYARVELEITPWSPDASELRLWPVSRSPHAWGAGRLRRYLRLAPQAADELVRHLAAAFTSAGSTEPTSGLSTVAGTVPVPVPADDRSGRSEPRATAA